MADPGTQRSLVKRLLSLATPRFRLRTLLIVIALVAGASATVGRYYYLQHCRSAAMRSIRDSGGHTLTAQGLPAAKAEEIERVYLSGVVSDDQLIELAGHLAYLPNLREVDVVGSNVTDKGLAALGDLPELEVLYVFNTTAAPEQLADLSKRFPGLDIRNEQPDPIASGLVMRPIYRHAVASMRQSPDGRYLAVGDGQGYLRSFSLNEKGLPEAWHRKRKAHENWTFDIAFSADGSMLATAGGDNRIVVWEAARLEKLFEFRGHTDDVHAVAFARNDQQLVSASDDMTVRVWDVATRKTKHILTGHTAAIPCLAISPDGETIASASRDGDVRLWSLADASLITVLAGHSADVHSVRFSADGKRLATSSYDKTVRIWNFDSRETEQSLAHDDWVYTSTWIANDRLVSAGRDGSLRLWNPNTGELLAVQREQGDVARIEAVGTKLLAVASAEGKITFWDRSLAEVVDTIGRHNRLF